MSYPSYANGQCDSLSDVMSVNVGYYQSWAIWRNTGCNKVTPVQIDVAGNRYTHLIYSFASIDANFEIEPWAGNLAEEVPLYIEFTGLKNSHSGLKTMIAVGGWTFNDPGATQTRFSDVSKSASSRATFAASCVAFCQTYGFDGIDLDWEYPADTTRGGIAEDKTNYGLLVKAIRDAFDAAPEDLEVTMAVPLAGWRLNEGYDLPVLSQHLDFFNIMAYDIYGSWSQNTGANTDMTFIFQTVKYFINNGVPRNKMVLGLAAYGRTFNLGNSNCFSPGCAFASAGPGGCAGEDGFMPYFTVDEYVRDQNYNSLSFNGTTGTMEMVINNNVWVSFDNPATYNIKADFAYEACFRGTMWWAVDMLTAPIVLTYGLNPTPPLPVTPSPISNQSPPLPATSAPVTAVTPGPVTPATLAPVTPVIPAPVTPATPTPVGTTSNWQNWLVSTSPRCGASELDARGNCRARCVSAADCGAGEWCWGTHANFCGSKPQPNERFIQSSVGLRCGVSELHARETCGKQCSHNGQCASGESCYGVNSNYCDSGDRRSLRGGK